MRDEFETGRFISAGAEELLGREFHLLGKGLIRLVDYMGADESVVQAARVSYGRGTTKRSRDRHLIRYLMRHKHTTPFEMIETKWHAKMPIFVARQWVRHRTASINEYSGRYSVMPDEFYVPTPERVQLQSTANRQGSGDAEVPSELQQRVLDILTSDANQVFSHYNEMEEENITRELARIGLPLSAYTEWYWKMDLHNLFHFLGLRIDKHAQWEMRQYAEKIGEMTKQAWPLCYEAFEDYRLDSTIFSALEKRAIKEILGGGDIQKAVDTHLETSFERKEFLEKWGGFQND